MARLGEVKCKRCEGDGYLDIPDPETGGVIGPRPCPDCQDGWRDARLEDFDPNVLAAVAEEMDDLARQHNAEDQADRDEQLEERRHHNA